MKGVVSLHDVSPYMYTGMSSSEYSKVSYSGFPLGGIKYFLHHLGTHIASREDYAFFFDSASFRKRLLPGYKSGRLSNPEVNLQLNLLYDVLVRCGFACYKVDKYEADDLIFSAVEQFRRQYSAVDIYSADYDLTHNVDGIVSFMAVNGNVNNVKSSNFSNSVVRGEHIMMNTVSAHKTFFGCTSDKIQPFKSDSITNRELYDGFCLFLQEVSKSSMPPPALGRDKRALLLYLRDRVSPKISSEEMEDLLTRVEVVYPAKYDEVEFKAVNRLNLEKSGLLELAGILTICKEYSTLKLLGLEPIPPSKADEEFFRGLANDLRTGAFAADRGLPLDNYAVRESSLMDLRDFV